MGSLSIWHWLIVLAVVVLVFGTKKLRNTGGDLGAAIKNFKASMKEGETEADADQKKGTESLTAEQRAATSAEAREKSQV